EKGGISIPVCSIIGGLSDAAFNGSRNASKSASGRFKATVIPEVRGTLVALPSFLTIKPERASCRRWRRSVSEEHPVAVRSHYPCKREPDTTRDEPRVSSLIVGASCIRDTHKTPRRTPPCALAGFVILSTAWVRFDERRGAYPLPPRLRSQSSKLPGL